MLERMRSFGMTPVLPAFSGAVPNDFGTKASATEVNNAGTWQGITAPGLIGHKSNKWEEVSKKYYEHLKAVMGTSKYYAMDVNHEDGSAPSIGGTQGGAVDVSSLTGGNIAMAISQRTGLPAQFIWAQMAHESANFQSDLARKDHNYAGVKGTDGEYLHFDSDEDFVNYMADYLPKYSNNGIFNTVLMFFRTFYHV